MVKGIAHIALYTERFDESIRFYREAFDAQMLGEFVTDRGACWLDIGGHILEIFESEPMGDGHFKHIAIACADVGAMYAKALRSGAAAQQPPKEITLPLNKPVHARVAFVKGPSGEQIELFQEL